MAAPDLFGILDAVKKLTAPAGMEVVHQDGMSWARNGLTYGDSTKLTADDWNRIIGNLRGLLVSSGVDLNTLNPASPMLLRDVLVNYIIAELADVLPDYIDDNAAAIAADIIADPTFAGVLASALGALTFKFATATADADPGAGNFRLNNAAPASATSAYIDNVDAYGVTVTGALDGWDDSTNTIRGTLTLGPTTNPAVRYIFSVTGSVVDGTGYRKLALAYVSGSGAIAPGASCWLVFNRAGDKGDFAGPASSVADNIVTFADATGKVGKNSGIKASDLIAGPATAVADNIATFNGTTGKIAKDSGVAVSSLAPKASPTFTGTPAAPTAAPGTNTTQLATTGFVAAAISAVTSGYQAASSVLSALASIGAAVAGDIIYGTGAGTWGRLAKNTDGLFLKLVGGLPSWGSSRIVTAAVATTSGAAIDFTGIPSWATEVKVEFAGLSSNGTSPYLFRIGSTAGGVEATGYLGAGCSVGVSQANYTTGFGVSGGIAAADVSHGVATFVLLEAATNQWSYFLMGGLSNGAFCIQAGGSKTLTGVLDRLRLTTVGGTDTFDAGKISVSYS